VRNIRRLILAGLMLVGLTIGGGLSNAWAAPDCVSAYDFCLYYNSGAYGYNAYRGFFSSNSNLYTSIFDMHYGNDAGIGQGVKNNAAAGRAINACSWTVYFFSGYGGPSDTFTSYTYGDLYNTTNEDASVKRSAACGG